MKLYFVFLIFAVVAFAEIASANVKSKIQKKPMSSESSFPSSSEEMFRRYQKAKKEVDELNKKYPTATFEINKFSFMTENERKKYSGTFLPLLQNSPNFVTFDDENITAPDSFDFRALGQVTSVKDQTLGRTRRCGSCYDFAATAAVESQFLIQQNLELDLSEEYVLDCDAVDSECEGGYPKNALDLYQKTGVPLADCLPYTGLNGTCPDGLTCDFYKIAGYKSLGTDEDLYPGLLYKYGPMAIGMNAGPPLQNYKGGILDLKPEECGTDGHAVLLVGYTEDYWIAKNSWGAGWGEDGYFRFQRGTNFCEFATMQSPVIPYLS